MNELQRNVHQTSMDEKMRAMLFADEITLRGESKNQLQDETDARTDTAKECYLTFSRGKSDNNKKMVIAMKTDGPPVKCIEIKEK